MGLHNPLSYTGTGRRIITQNNVSEKVINGLRCCSKRWEGRRNSLHIIMIKLFWYGSCLPVQWEPGCVVFGLIGPQEPKLGYIIQPLVLSDVSSPCTCQWPVVNSLNTHITCQLWLAFKAGTYRRVPAVSSSVALRKREPCTGCC